MANLTDEEITSVFNVFDMEGSGTINISDLDTALRLLRIDLTPEEFQEKLREGDYLDSMSEDEFRDFVRLRVGDVDYQQKCRESLGEFDEENTGRLSFDTVKRILTQMGSDPLDPESADELIREFESTDGYVSISDIVNLMYDTEGLF